MSNGTSTIVAALIIGLAFVAGSFQVSSSLDQAGEKLGGIQEAMVQIAKNPPSAAPAAAPAPARRRGPDPSRQYKISLGNAPVEGNKNAKVTIVEFSDFQCPFCSRVFPTIQRIKKEYGDQVRIAYKHLPLDFHTKAQPAARAAIAAGKQGKFWEMHDKIFQNQKVMSPAKYEEWAAEMGLDVAQFKKDMASPEVQKQIDADKMQAAQLGVTGTPSFFINGYFLSGAQPFEAFKVAIDKQLKG